MMLSPDIEKFLFVFDPTLYMRRARLYLLAGAGDGLKSYDSKKSLAFLPFVVP